MPPAKDMLRERTVINTSGGPSPDGALRKMMMVAAGMPARLESGFIAAKDGPADGCGARARRQADGGRKVVRRIGNRIGAEHQHIVEAQRIPVNPPDTGDPRGAFHAQQVDGDPVPDAQVDGLGQVLQRDRGITL